MHVQNLMNSLWDIRIFLGLVPKESHCISEETQNPETNPWKITAKIVLALIVFLISCVLSCHAPLTHIISTANTHFSDITLIKIIFHMNNKLKYTLLVLTCLPLINSSLNPLALLCNSLVFITQFKRYATCSCNTNYLPTDL